MNKITQIIDNATTTITNLGKVDTGYVTTINSEVDVLKNTISNLKKKNDQLLLGLTINMAISVVLCLIIIF